MGESTNLQERVGRIPEENQLGRESLVGKTPASTQQLKSAATFEELFCYMVWSAAQLHIFIHPNVQINTRCAHDLLELNFSNCSINSLERFLPLLALDHDFP